MLDHIFHDCTFGEQLALYPPGRGARSDTVMASNEAGQQCIINIILKYLDFVNVRTARGYAWKALADSILL
jgi:hypothetical protein